LLLAAADQRALRRFARLPARLVQTHRNPALRPALVPHQRLSVDVQCHFRTAVTQEFLNNLNVLAVCSEKAREGPPERVPGNPLLNPEFPDQRSVETGEQHWAIESG